MAIDLFASARSTALISLVAASFSAPVVIQGDALAGAKAKLGGAPATAHSEPPEELIAGGVRFELPADWGRLGATTASGGASSEKRVGTVVTAVCPAGSKAGTCAGEVTLTFLAYSGRDGRELPMLSAFGGDLDEQLDAQHHGFERTKSRSHSSTDGSRYLDYRYTWQPKGGPERSQRLAAFRHEDGSGVVVVASGAGVDEHAKAIDAFLGTASDPLTGE